MNELRGLWRGKLKVNGKWVEGYRVELQQEKGADPLCLIIGLEGQYNPVDPKTYGECTGLRDKNGKPIFEGDIVRYQIDNDDCPFPNKDTKKRTGNIYWQEFRSCFALDMSGNCSGWINNDLYRYVQNGNRVEIIGNIHDNPELLKGVGNEDN